MSEHINSNGLDKIHQSAYNEWHSIETDLLKVYDDLLYANDNRKHILITWLDFNAAFDTVDHDILFKRLKCYGVLGAALDWMKFYFSNHLQVDSINGLTSQQHTPIWNRQWLCIQLLQLPQVLLPNRQNGREAQCQTSSVSS